MIQRNILGPQHVWWKNEFTSLSQDAFPQLDSHYAENEENEEA